MLKGEIVGKGMTKILWNVLNRKINETIMDLKNLKY